METKIRLQYEWKKERGYGNCHKWPWGRVNVAVNFLTQVTYFSFVSNSLAYITIPSSYMSLPNQKPSSSYSFLPLFKSSVRSPSNGLLTSLFHNSLVVHPLLRKYRIHHCLPARDDSYFPRSPQTSSSTALINAPPHPGLIDHTFY